MTSCTYSLKSLPHKPLPVNLIFSDLNVLKTIKIHEIFVIELIA